MSTPDELRELVESYLADLALTPELDGLEESMRKALAGGGKRVRPVLCLATAEAAMHRTHRALDGIAAHGHDLDAWLGELGITLSWKPRPTR